MITRKCKECSAKLPETRYFKCLNCQPKERLEDSADDDLIYFQLDGREEDDLIGE
jgi:hypothetical protein